MYVITVEFRISQGNEARFMDRMREQAANSLNGEEGCLQFDVCADPKDDGRVFLYEIYRDESAFQDHLETAHFKDFDAAVAPWIASKQVEAWHRVT